MKTKLSIALAVLVVFGIACSKPAPGTTAPAAFVDSSAKASPTRDLNPTKDPKIADGIKKNEEADREKRERENEERRIKERQKNNQLERPYDVDISGTTPKQSRKPKK